MVGQINKVAIVTGDTTIRATGSRGIVKAIYVTKSGGAGSKLDLKVGGSGGTILITVEGEAVQSLPVINTPFNDGIYADHTTGGSYLVVYE